MTVFICHSSRDDAQVRALVRHLQAAHETVWLDQSLLGGEAWWSKILHQIRSCTVFLLAMSNHSLQSKPCRAEINYAKALKLPILPVLIGEVDSYRIDPVFTVQSVDYRNPDVTSGAALIAAVRERTAERRDLPDPLPEPPPLPYEYLQRLGVAIDSPDELSPTEQTTILLELRRAFRDEDDETVRADITRLLRALRRRSEATHATVADIDELLSKESTATAETPFSGPSQPEKPHPLADTVAPGHAPEAVSADASMKPSTATDWAAAPHQPQELPPRTGRPKWLIPLIAGLVVVVAIAVGAVTVFLVQDRSKPAAPVLGLAPQYLVNPIIPVGRTPADVAVDPTTHAVYVANFADDSVSVIDGRTYAVTTTIPGVPLPQYVTIDSTTHTLYITNGSNSGQPGTVTVIDTTHNTVTATIPVGIDPLGSALDPDTHLLYVVNENTDLNPPDNNHLYTAQPGSLSVIDTTRNTVTAAIPVGRGPQYAATDPRTHRLYITNENDGTLSVIDTSARTTVATVRVGTAPKGVTVDADTNTVYVANFEAASISVIDAMTNTVRTTVQTGNNPIAITVDAVRKLLYTANIPPRDDPTRPVSAAAIDTRTFASVVITGVGKIPSGVALDIDSGALYVADRDGGKVYVVKPCYNCQAHPT